MTHDDTGSATARETSAWHALAKRRLGMSCMFDCCISFCLIFLVCAVNAGNLYLQPATTFIPAFFYSSILWPVILAQREVKQKRQQNVLRQSPSRSSFGAVLKVMFGFSKECPIFLSPGHLTSQAMP